MLGFIDPKQSGVPSVSSPVMFIVPISVSPGIVVLFEGIFVVFQKHTHIFIESLFPFLNKKHIFLFL